MSDIKTTERRLRKNQKTQTLSDPIELEQHILNYLKANPDFLYNHSKDLTGLNLPFDQGLNSLVTRQIKALRERNITLRRKINELIEIATTNENILNKTFALTMALFEANSLDSFYQRLYDHLKEEFQKENVHFLIFNKQIHPMQKKDYINYTELENAQKNVKFLFTHTSVFCGLLREKEARILFPKQLKIIRSAALIPLQPSLAGKSYSTPQGFLSIGSSDPLYFKAKQGQTFLNQLQQVSNLCLAKLSESKASVKAHQF